MKHIMKMTVSCMMLFYLLMSCKTRQGLYPPGPSYPILQQSFIHVPVKVYAVPFINKAAELAPAALTSAGWPEFVQQACDFRYKYRFVRSGLRLTCVNNQATFTLSGNYQLAGSKSICAFGRQVGPWITGSCGFSPEPMRRIEISMNTKLRFLPDYTINSTSAIDRINPVDKCTVTLLNADITGEVTGTIRSAARSFSSALDKALRELTFPEILQSAEAQLGGKIRMNDYGYLKVNPAAVTISPLNYARDTLFLTVGVACYPEITSDSSNNEPARRLPALNSSALNSGFSVSMNAAYDYPFINSHLNNMVKNTPLHIRGNTIVVRQIAVRGLEQHKIELKIIFGGSKSGTVFLTGTPVLDVQRQVISMPDLNYTLQSRNLLLTLGKTFLNKMIIRTIRQKAVLRTRDVFRENRKTLDSVLNRKIAPNAYTMGNVRDIQLTGLDVRTGNLLFMMNATGMLEVIVTGP